MHTCSLMTVCWSRVDHSPRYHQRIIVANVLILTEVSLVALYFCYTNSSDEGTLFTRRFFR